MKNHADITTDSQSNLYLTGKFGSTLNFDPGETNTTLTSVGEDDIYILKLGSNGNFIGVKQLGSPKDDRGWSITLNISGAVYVTGYFEETLVYEPSIGEVKLTSLGERDMFVLKLGTDGNFNWLKQMGGTDNIVGNNIGGHALTIDSNGNIYTTGSFVETADFDPGSAVYSLTPEGSYDSFVQKMNSDGIFQWAAHMGGQAFIFLKSQMFIRKPRSES